MSTIKLQKKHVSGGLQTARRRSVWASIVQMRDVCGQHMATCRSHAQWATAIFYSQGKLVRFTKTSVCSELKYHPCALWEVGVYQNRETSQFDPLKKKNRPKPKGPGHLPIKLHTQVHWSANKPTIHASANNVKPCIQSPLEDCDATSMYINKSYFR